MKKGFFGAFLVVFVGTNVAMAQGTGQTLPPPLSAQQLQHPMPTTSAGVLDDRDWGPSRGGALRFWASAEYLHWWTNGASLPALVTTGPALPIAPTPGSFAAPGTVVLFGGNQGGGPYSGGRFSLGFWCNDCQMVGAEANFLFLGQQANNFSAATSGLPGSIVLARPFFDTRTGTFNTELVGYPGLAAGSISVSSINSLLGAEANLLRNLCRSCDNPCPDVCDPCARPVRRYRVDVLAGFRYLELRDDLLIVEDTQVAANAPAFAGTNIVGTEQFDTVNRFYGGQVGIRGEWWSNRFFFNASARVALGVTHQRVDINGSTRVTPPGGAAVVLPGNLFAQPTNIGRYSRNQFSVVPELATNIGYQVTQNVDLFAGYTFIYWTNVQRPGDAISTQVNSTRVPTSMVAPTGPLDPQFSFRNSNFWTHGINVGMQIRF